MEVAALRRLILPNSSSPAGKAKTGGYPALLPDAGLGSERTQRSYLEGQRDAATERQLSSQGKTMNAALIRLAAILAEHISLSAVLQKHLGFSRASVRLVNHPRRGLYLKSLKGQPILRAKLFNFLAALPQRQSWRDISGYPFAIDLILRTERRPQAPPKSAHTTIADGTITHLIVSQEVSGAEKYLTATTTPKGQVQGGVNILALLEPLLAGDEHEELRREIKSLRRSRAFRGPLEFFQLSKSP